ncbi:hypothetical protein [Rhizobium sp. CRRU65]|uniref:hypothetical protein n=1 Tax=Rhizobium sp. CRRU65 TaxID=3399566 RepID=UPI003AF94A97
MEIAALLHVKTAVVTDNDGDLAALAAKYAKFDGVRDITVCYDGDIAFPTLEPQLFKKNGLEKVNKILGTTYATKELLLAFMSKNKTECALRFFDTTEDWEAPEYIANAVQ